MSNSEEGNAATTMDDWLKAGRITAEVREFSRPLVRKGAKLIDIAEQVEAKIKELGAVPAFPVNLSMNEIAAHYTPVPDDQLVFEDQVVKVDIGVCYNGAIGDTAYTVDLSGKYSEMVKASEEALGNVIKIIRPGTTLGEIGRTILETIQSYGYSPIKNLSGHGLGEYSVHERPSIPNYDTGDKTQIKEGMAFAIEPFATDGAGLIKESDNAMIFSQIQNKPVRSQYAREILADIETFHGLPFATRWLAKKHSEARLKLGIRELMLANILRDYPPLPEFRKGIVTQAEHSFFCMADKVVVTTG
jgi:methionyl aminopeptidase